MSQKWFHTVFQPESPECSNQQRRVRRNMLVGRHVLLCWLAIAMMLGVVTPLTSSGVIAKEENLATKLPAQTATSTSTQDTQDEQDMQEENTPASTSVQDAGTSPPTPNAKEMLQQCLGTLQQVDGELKKIHKNLQYKSEKQVESIKKKQEKEKKTYQQLHTVALALLQRLLNDNPYELKRCEELRDIQLLADSSGVRLVLAGKVIAPNAVRAHYLKVLDNVKGVQVQDDGLQQIPSGRCLLQLPNCALDLEKVAEGNLPHRSLASLSNVLIEKLPKDEQCADLGQALQKQFPEVFGKYQAFWVQREDGIGLCRKLDDEWLVRKRNLQGFHGLVLECLQQE